MRYIATLINEMADFDGSKAIPVSNIISSPSFNTLAKRIHALWSHELGLVNSIKYWQGHKGHVHYQNLVLWAPPYNVPFHFPVPSSHKSRCISVLWEIKSTGLAGSCPRSAAHCGELRLTETCARHLAQARSLSFQESQACWKTGGIGGIWKFKKSWSKWRKRGA